jgi:uncharacterized protein (TIGR00661 family)
LVKYKKILFAVMGWGLGHVTRSIPLIDSLIQDNEIILASNGNAISFLESNYPQSRVIQFPDYAVHYPRFKFLLIPSIIFQTPRIWYQIYREYKLTKKLVQDENIQMIISDCRYGVFDKRIPSFFITHQLRFQLTGIFKPLENLGEKLNRVMFKNFTKVLVMDNKNSITLSGALSHQLSDNSVNLQYIGPFSSVVPSESTQDIDVLVSISGPEIQRTLFENTIMKQIHSLPGKKIVVLGKPDKNTNAQKVKDTTIYNHVTRAKMNDLMNRAKLVVCRSGYSTIMELAALQKKALLIPTPGQTEQEYLATHLSALGIFYTVSQHTLNLQHDIKNCIEPEKLSQISINNLKAFTSAISVD